MNAITFLALVLCFGVVTYYIGYMANINGHNAGYDEGWRDCEKAHRYFEQTDDEEKVLAEIRNATKKHIKESGNYKRGDMKALDMAKDVSELKHLIYNICVLRKENA